MIGGLPPNPLLAPVPAQMTCGRIRAGDGTEVLLLIISTPTGQTIVHLTRGEGEQWADAIRAESRKISPLIIGQPVNGDAPNGGPPR